MTSYDYEAPTRERSTRKTYREVRYDDRDPRYGDSRDSYHDTYSRELVPRGREGSELSVEEVRREFPPPGYSRDARRARSAEPGYYDEFYDDRRSYSGRERDYDREYDRYAEREYDHDYDHRSKKGSSVTYEEESRKKARMLSKQEQIIAAVTGAALAIGGKEIYDRREAHGGDVHRNLLTSAAIGAAGAFAGYQGSEFYNKQKEKEEKKSTYVVHKGRDGKVSEYYSDEDEDSGEKKGHKNFLEGALAAAGLGGAVKALTGRDHKDDRSDTRSRAGSRERDRSRGRGAGANKIQKAAMASLIAGATEAFRVSKEPGAWRGEKAKRILTAAAGAATIDAAQNPDKAGSKLGIAESVIGGLIGNRVINGSKKNIDEDPETGRSRSRSRAASRAGGGGGGGMGGLAALATAGIGAVAGKKILDNVGERSRSRRRSVDSYDSRDGSPDRRRNRSRSRSIVDGARRSLAKLGIGNGPDDDDRDDRSRDRSRDRKRDRDDYDDDYRGSRRTRGYDDDDYDDRDRGHGRRGGRDDDYDDRSARSGRDRDRDRDRSRSRQRRGKDETDSDLGDSEEDEKRAKKMRGKQILTAGLAAVATIHAAHNVYQSMEKRNARHKAVKEGRLSPEEAKKLKTKALLQDAASVGIAALGIKGAISELKEVQESRHEYKEWQEEKEKRHKKRLERIRRQKRITNGEEGDDEDDDYDFRNGYSPYGRRRADGWSSAAPPRANRYDDGPCYTDGNPYTALPAPPVGYSDRR